MQKKNRAAGSPSSVPGENTEPGSKPIEMENQAPGNEDPADTEETDLAFPNDLFQEPTSFRPASPEPTIIEHTSSDGTPLKIRLVGAHPLWGAGLKWGAKLAEEILLQDRTISSDVGASCPAAAASSTSPGFDLILLSDLVFNHSEHQSLLTTCELSLNSASPGTDRPTPSLLVFYSHHRPWCVAADEQFFVIARQRGWICTRIIEDKNAGLAFPADTGDADIRGTVHGWILTRQ
ncbi:nicotinamide n-methyltransferase [Puccinia graminis f. sp. tritici]|uniref:Nicotinamide n-methyltransferase n=1 Tax=Puccinia graminis f. sp. tritici TaxID=56615 RepID=A0A5B0RPF2_PUCGR|nr:nicotinamide n-methyltransferase [Puccinia graminis f. sp. tritici]